MLSADTGTFFPMKMSRLSTLFITAWLAACTVSDQNDSAFHGDYILGHEVHSFQPCGSEKVYWIKTSPEIQKELVDYHQANTSKPYEAVYIEFVGKILDDKRTGFARDHDGLIRINTILKTTSTSCINHRTSSF
jgi:hypothetical protein